MIPAWRERLAAIPERPGVYLMRDNRHAIVYIGKAKNLRRRLASYFREDREPKIAALVSALRHIDYILASSEREALILERSLIGRIQPHFNALWKDDKSYPWIKLTMGEDFPRLQMVRKRLADGGAYFGPYPQVQQVQKLFFWLRRIFRLRPCKLEFSRGQLPRPDTVKSCLYLHTGRCDGPCLGRIGTTAYRRSAREVRSFLGGRFSAVRRRWEREMAQASRKLDYERAAILRDRIAAVRSMEEPVSVRELSADEVPSALNSSAALEKLGRSLGLPGPPSVIEAFDVSHHAGSEPVASMVRFGGGRPDPEGYRRFRIRTVAGIDDTAMMSEVVLRRYRRLKTENSALPDLVVIDGGKGQLRAAMTALASAGVSVPIVAIAKRHEELFLPGAEKPLTLPMDAPELSLLRAIRDESHRFAVRFHRYRRSRTFHPAKSMTAVRKRPRGAT